MSDLADASYSDEKYGKIRRQSQAKTRSMFAFIFGACCIGTFLFYRNELMAFIGLQPSTGVGEGGSSLRTVSSSGAVIVPLLLAEYNTETPDMLAKVQELDADVRRIKETGVIMEADGESKIATKKLQDATRTLLHARYGIKEPYRVKVTLQFQDTIPDFEENGPAGELLLEMAPTRLVPHAVYTYLEEARLWQGGAFHRIANHVLQVRVSGKIVKHLAFQEYSPEWPHQKGTVGYAGRPSGPEWYVSIMNNTRAHGPGSQQKHNPYEADSCFGKVISGMENEIKRISKVPGKEFIGDKKKHVLITKMQILVPSSGPDAVEGYTEWKENL